MPPAPVAQLDRASGFEPEGREFESLRARHFPLTWSTERSLANSASGFRLQAPAALTPANRLKFESLRARHLFLFIPCHSFALNLVDRIPLLELFLELRELLLQVRDLLMKV